MPIYHVERGDECDLNCFLSCRYTIMGECANHMLEADIERQFVGVGPIGKVRVGIVRCTAAGQYDDSARNLRIGSRTLVGNTVQRTRYPKREQADLYSGQYC